METMLLKKLALCQGMGIEKKWRLYHYAKEMEKHFLSYQEVEKVLGYHRFSPVVAENWQRLTSEAIEESLLGQKMIAITNPLYPDYLKEISYPPLLLFYEGRKELLQKRLFAFVGAREATSYGQKVVAEFIPSLVGANYVIVSGLAKGIDSCAHQKAIYAGGFTIGVLGCGLDVCYPASNRLLFQEMKKNQLVISEYPKGVPPRKHHFPLRNRIIAGLSLGLCVVEAKERSGSLITASQALEDGREVFAIPGNILDGRSQGCHRLIQDGAKCVCCLQDILEELPEF